MNRNILLINLCNHNISEESFCCAYIRDVEADGDAICADYSRSDQKSNNSDGDNFINPAAFLYTFCLFFKTI